jgi:hypothetical protein
LMQQTQAGLKRAQAEADTAESDARIKRAISKSAEGYSAAMDEIRSPNGLASQGERMLNPLAGSGTPAAPPKTQEAPRPSCVAWCHGHPP